MALELSLRPAEPIQTITLTEQTVTCPEYTDNLNILINLELIHEIHTSERKSFRGCRRRWDWLYRQHYYPRVTAKPLEFGVAYHVGMETFYRPETWKLPVDIKVERAIQEFTQECEKQKAEAIKVGLFNDFEELENDYDERIVLGTGMIRYHAQYVHPKEDLARELIPVKVEIEFMVPIPNPETGEECIYCKCDECYDKWLAHFFPVGQSEWPQWYINNKWAFSKGIPVVYGGRLDALFIDKYGNYWVVDWKAQPIDAPILTEYGWTTMGQLEVGTKIIGSNGKPTEVVGVYPQGEKEVYELELRDGGKIEATAEHLWTMYRNDGLCKVLTTKELTRPQNKYVYFPELEPVVLDSMDYKIHPYVLGLLLGDGSFRGGTVRFSSADDFLTTEIFNLQDTWVRGAKFNYDTNICNAVSDIRELGLLNHLAVDKFIPEQYKCGSIEQRLDLIRGLMDTDGYVSKGIGKFCTSSIQLAKDIKQVADSLGGKNTLWVRDKIRDGSKVHECIVTIRLPNMNPFSLERKASLIKEDKQNLRRTLKSVKLSRTTQTQCIRVDNPNSLYVGQDYILTHNTAAQMREDKEFLLLDDQIGSYVWALRKLGLNVAGFIYHEMFKGFPNPPKQNKTRREGRIFSVDKTQATTYKIYLQTVSREDTEAWSDGKYDDMLNYLQAEGRKFYDRRQIPKTEAEVNSIEYNIGLEALDMLDKQIRLYPSANRFGCGFCAYREPCIAKNNKDDFEYTLDTVYTRKEHYFKEMRQSTDTLVE